MPFFWSNGSWSVIPHWVRCEAFLPGFSFAREPKPSALHKQGAVARLLLLNSGSREILPDDPVRDFGDAVVTYTFLAGGR